MRWLTGSHVVSQDKIVLVTAVIRDVCARLVFAVRTQTTSLGGLASLLPVKYDRGRGHSDVGNSWGFFPSMCVHGCIPTVPT